MFIKGYSDFSLSKAGVMFGGMLGACFKLDNDVRQLFPYINATISGAKLYDQPEYIQFHMGDIQCTLYPQDVIAAFFTDQDQDDPARYEYFFSILYHFWVRRYTVLWLLIQVKRYQR